MSDRIAVINDGELQQIDPPLTCYNEPANEFVAGFIGSPSMNFVRGEVTADGFASEHMTVEFDPGAMGVAPGEPVTLGIRPEDVYPVDQRDQVANATATIEATTDVLEPMGNEIFIYLLLSEELETSMEDIDAGGQLLMSVSPDSDIAEDQEIEVVLDRTRVHLFDAESGEAVVHGLVEPPTADEGPEAGTEVEGDD